MLDASLGALATTTVFAENTVNAAPVVLDNNVSVTGSTTDFDGESLTISTNGGADDQISIQDEGNGAGHIGFDGTNVSYEGTVIGTVSSDGSNGSDLVIDFDADASKAGIERLIENITYANDSDNPVTSRTLNFSLGVLFSEDMNVVIVADNEGPTVTNNGMTTDEADTETLTAAMLGITDSDDAASDLVINVTSNVSHGQLELTTNAGVAITSFTMDDINNNRVVYVHDDSDTTSDSFDFTVTDGEIVTATDTFNITINAVNDPLTLDTNTGTEVVSGEDVQIGGTDIPAKFGTELQRYSGTGNYGSFSGLVNGNVDTQISLIFTTGNNMPTGVPGEVLFETGGSGRGIALILNDQNELEMYFGNATNSPRILAPTALATGTQYAVVLEYSSSADEIRMHYQQAGDFDWFSVGRTAEAALGGWNDTNLAGGNGTGFGQANSSIGGYNSTISGVTAFQGTMDSDLVITRAPSGQTIIENTKLVTTDPDTAANNIVYTITTDAQNGELYNGGVSLGLNDTFTQADLDSGVVTYTHNGVSTNPDSFVFSVSDGTTTITNQTYDISVVNDPPSVDTNAGTDVFVGDEAQIGADLPDKFGTEVNRLSGVGQHGNLQNLVDNQNTQFSLIFTTPGSTPNSVPGEVLFESGGSGRGIGLYLNDQGRLAWHAGAAQSTPILTSGAALSASTQYAVIMEIDSTNNEIRMHYQQAGDFNWFYFGRDAENTLTGFADGDVDGGNGAGLGEVGNGSYGGYTGAVSGTTTFQGSIDSDLVMTRFPTSGAADNTKLVTADPDSSTDNLVYTITTDAVDGELYRDGVLLSVNDTFTQADLDRGFITYTHGGALDASDSFIFSVTDGTTTITNQTYDIRVDIANDAPVLDTSTTLNVNEDANNGSTVGTISAIDPDVGQTITYSITGGTGSGIFEIDSESGEITVLNNATLDYETTTSYTLTVRATDDFGVPEFDEHTFTINVQDIYEGTAPAFTLTGPFDVDENAAVNDAVGTVAATDVDGDDISYAITNGNGDNIFKINASTGVISINSTANLDYETRTTYTLTIRATDDSVDTLFTNQNVTININDINEGPTFDNETVIEELNAGVFYSSATGNFYQFVNNNVNYATALSNASAATLNGVSGHLVTITSAAENNFVQSLISESVWLGASDAGVEGNWQWFFGPEAGQQFSNGATSVGGMYENWQNSQPNNWNNQDYAEFRTDGQWSDIADTDSRRYVIEWENGNGQVINNTAYTIAHANADASDVALNSSVGFIQGYDVEGDTLEYSIQGGNGDGIFAIDINTGEITIADKTNLDASVTDTYTLTVRAQEQGGGLFVEKNITVSFDQSFTIGQNNNVSVSENSSVTIDNTDLQVLDNDTAATDLVYSVTTAPVNGQIELTSAPGVAAVTFTQDDIDNNRLVYVHDGTETLSDSFTFSVTDGSETLTNQTFNFTVDPINQGPSISTNTGATVAEGGSVTIDNTMLAGTDGDDTASEITYTASNYVNGHIEVNGVIQNTFTQDDIDNNNVVFVHDGAETDGSFDFSLADGGEDAAAPATGTFTLTKTDVNDAPLISTNNPATVVEGGTVVITTAELNATDPDDGAANISYTLSNIENGFVELTTAPGVPVLGFTQDDLDANRVVFRHGGGENEGIFDVTVSDGAGLTDTVSFTVNRTPVNDGPTILANVGSSINQNSIVILKSSVLLAQDPDDNPAGITYTVSNLVNGQIEFFANPNVAVTTFTQDDINNSRIVFRHSGPPGAASFDFTVSDGGEDGAGTDSGTFNLTVDNVNDAPTITTNLGGAFDEGTANVITTAMLDSFDPDDFGTGLTWTISNVSANGYVDLSTNPGVAISSFTQADLDNGLVRFVHDGSETTTASFDLSLADGGEDGAGTDTTTFNITINPVNEGPGIVTNTGTTVIEGANVTLTNAMLDSADIDDTATGLTYTASNYSGGHIEVSGVTQNTFTQDDIDNNRVVFVHDGSEAALAGFDISLADGGENGVSPATGSFAISVTPVDDAPAIATNNGLSVNEGSTTTLSVAELTTTDVDTAPEDVVFTVTGALTNGQLELTTSPGNAISSFTLEDLQNNHVVYVHDGSETVSDSFDFTIEDATTTLAQDTFNITVTPQNDGAVIAGDLSATINEEGAYFLTAADLAALDPDDTNANVTFTVSNLSNGAITVSAVVQNTFTYQNILDGNVAFVHDGSETTTAGFDISLADGLEHGAVADTATFNFAVTPVNDDPVIAVNTGATMDEGASLTITNAMLREGDPDDSGTGLVFTVGALINGHIEVNGVTQNTFTQDDIDNSRVVFVHDGSETVSAQFTLSLADGGEDGSLAASGVFNIVVNPSNDLPTLATNTGATLAEGDTVTLDQTMLAATDIESADASLTYTITALPAGVLENTNTALTLGIGDSFTQSDLDSGFIRYTHDGGEGAQQVLSFTISDGTDFSAAENFIFTITPVNDAPTLIEMEGGEVAENSANGTVVATLTTLDVDLPGDSFTYTITSDTRGLFAISGSNIIVSGNIDFEMLRDMDLIIQADDGNGGIISETFTVSVTDVAERSASDLIPFVKIQEENNTGRFGQATFAQDDSPFFGRGLEEERGLGKTILRENTTLLLSALLEERNFYSLGSYIPVIGDAGSLFQVSAETEEEDFFLQEESFTTIEEALSFLESLESEDQNLSDEVELGEDGMINAQKYVNTVEKQLHDVLAYHQEKQNKLQQALI